MQGWEEILTNDDGELRAVAFSVSINQLNSLLVMPSDLRPPVIEYLFLLS
jgi:hypothetical protein